VTVRRYREGPGVEAMDHVPSRVRERGNCNPLRRVFGIEVDPLLEFCHGDEQADGRKAEDRFSAPDQSDDPAVGFASENFFLNTFRIDKQDFFDTFHVAVHGKLGLVPSSQCRNSASVMRLIADSFIFELLANDIWRFSGRSLAAIWTRYSAASAASIGITASTSVNPPDCRSHSRA
jgi:hypothetical protein